MINWHKTRQTFLGKMKFQLLGFSAIIVLLVVHVILNAKDYNDGWILEGLIPYFLLFALAYSVLASFSPNLKLITITTSIFLVVVNLIPNLKYVFIYGSHDPLAHHGFAKEMINSGHIPRTGVYAGTYGSSPGLHIFLSTLSISTGLDVSASMKLFLIVLPLIQPLAVYLVTKRLNLPEGLSKIAVISTAVTSPTTYIFTGTSSCYFLYVFFSYFTVLFLVKGQLGRQDLLLAVIFGFAIAFFHDATSFFLLLFFAVALVVFGSRNARARMYASFWIIAYSTHFLFVSETNFANLLGLLQRLAIQLVSGEKPFVTGYYGGFFQLGLIGRAKVLAVALGRDLITMLLSILSILVIFRFRFKKSELNKFYRVLVLLVFLPVLAFVLSLIGIPVKHRFLYYFLAVSPFLVGTTLWYFIYVGARIRSRSSTFNRLILTIVVFSLVCASIVQTYPYQPLVPKVATEYGDLYVVDYRKANSIFQRSLISFVYKYNDRLSIGTDGVTAWQIYGLTEPYFQALLTEDPILYNETQASIILFSGESIYYGGYALARQDYLREALETMGVIYNNGKSYSLSNLTGG